MATAYERRVRSRQVSRVAFLPTTVTLLWVVTKTDVYELSELLFVGVGCGVLGIALSRWLGEALTGSTLLYTTGLAVSGLGLASFPVETTGHLVVGIGLLYLTVVYW